MPTWRYRPTRCRLPAVRLLVLALAVVVPLAASAQDPFVPSAYPLRDAQWPATGTYDDGLHDGMRDANHPSTREWAAPACSGRSAVSAPPAPRSSSISRSIG